MPSAPGIRTRRRPAFLSTNPFPAAFLAAMAFLIAAAPASATGVDDGITLRVSVDSAGSQADGRSGLADDGVAISADGRYVAFDSDATNLVSGDTNGRSDVFVHDRDSGATTRVSVDSAGSQANGSSAKPAISANGRFVAFRSSATNLDTGDINGVDDVFVHDRETAVTVRVSVTSDGTAANGPSSSLAISGDGRFVAFASLASNLVAGDTNGVRDVFVHDRDADGDGVFDAPGGIATTRVSVGAGGAQANGENRAPAISGDGRFVVFDSSASNLVAGDTNGVSDVFLHDRQTGQTTRQSVSTSGVEGNGASTDPGLSGNGRFITYQSDATNLVSGDTNGVTDVIVRDRIGGTTARVSVDSSGAQATGASTDPAISAGGRFIAYRSAADNLVSDDTNALPDVFVYDRQTAGTRRLSLDSAGVQANLNSIDPSLSGDGRVAVFTSLATNLVPGDTNAVFDVFVRDLSDHTPPVIVCPDPITAECAKPGGASVSFTVTATDPCQPDPAVACVPASGSLFPPGTTPVLCTATDAAGNQSSCTFDVIVADTTPPSITCPVDVSAECLDAAGTPVTFDAFAADVCDAAPEVACVPPSGALFTLGITAVTCSATDASGNVAMCTFDVTVVDTTPPVITCPSDVAAECEGPAGASVAFAPTAADTCDPAPALDCVPPSGSVFPIGTTNVSCTATDASGNGSSCSFAVTVADTTPPSIACPADLTVDCSVGAGPIASYTASATDVCDLAPVATCVPPSGTAFPLGTTMVVCSASDAAGNSASCSFFVTVTGVTLAAILPASGSENGDDLVSAIGCGFTDLLDTVVLVGGIGAAVVDVSPERVRFRTPPGTGVVDVSVINSGGAATLPLSFTYLEPGLAARLGNVNVALGEREDVLAVNGSAGNAEREVIVALSERITVTIAPPSSRLVSRHVTYAWNRMPDGTTLKTMPSGLGVMIFPTPLTAECTPQPRAIWNNIGFPNALGQPRFPSQPAPSIIVDRTRGIARPLTVAFQGIIRDDGSQILQGFSITNAVIMRVE